jgi:hypothetical protein
MSHRLTLEPQPIADQWMAKCDCGWRATESVFDHRNPIGLLDSLKSKHDQHLKEST